jgi:glucose-fructose oxidoreductase
VESKKAMGGGSLYNLGVYPIQSARHTKGKDRIYGTAYATTNREDILKEVDEIFTWQLEWTDGTLCNSYSEPVAVWLFAACTHGYIEMNPCMAYTDQAGKSSKR